MGLGEAQPGVGREPDQATAGEDMAERSGAISEPAVCACFIRRGRRFGASEWGTVPGPVLNGRFLTGLERDDPAAADPFRDGIPSTLNGVYPFQKGA